MVTVEQEIFACERDWLHALEMHDLKRLEQLLADDFTLTSWASQGEVLSKDKYLNEVLSVGISSVEIDDCTVQVYENVVVLKCRFHGNADFEGRDWRADFLITDVWVKRSAGWQAVTRHASTPITYVNIGDTALEIA